MHGFLLKSTLAIASKIVEFTADQLVDFLEFEEKFNKSYKNADEESKAMKNFILNLNFITNHNKRFDRGLTKFRAGVWQHSDIDVSKFIEDFTGYTGRPKARSFRNDFPDENIPESLNYTKLGYVTRVMYQGFCGGCW